MRLWIELIILDPTRHYLAEENYQNEKVKTVAVKKYKILINKERNITKNNHTKTD